MNLDEEGRRSFLKWVASGTIAALAISFSTSYRLATVIPIFVAIIAAVFWYIEAKWKLFQYALADRIRVIEAYFRDDADMPFRDPAPFQIYNFWFRTYLDDLPLYDYEKSYRPKPRRKRLWAAAKQPFVHALYVTIIILSAVSFLLLLVFPAAKP